MQGHAEAVVVAVRAHGEHGAIVRVMTAEYGLIAGYIRGGRGRAMRPVLIPGNRVAAVWRARTESQLASLTVELERSRAPLLAEPLAALAIGWLTGLVATALGEGQPYPQIHAALEGALTAIENADTARDWAPALVAAESVILGALGYGSGGEARWQDRVPANAARFAEHVLTGRGGNVLHVRERLVERLLNAGVLT